MNNQGSRNGQQPGHQSGQQPGRRRTHQTGPFPDIPPELRETPTIDVEPVIDPNVASAATSGIHGDTIPISESSESGVSPAIRHKTSALGRDPRGGSEDPAHQDEGSPKIRTFDQKLGRKTSSDGGDWKRKPSVTGTGASHVRTFHSKLNPDSIAYMDQQINEWLERHDDFEVKFVSTTIGEWAGKLGTEPHLICQVWV